MEEIGKVKDTKIKLADPLISIMKENLLNFEKSKKHVVAREMGNMEPTESLKYKKAA